MDFITRLKQQTDDDNQNNQTNYVVSGSGPGPIDVAASPSQDNELMDQISAA